MLRKGSRILISPFDLPLTHSVVTEVANDPLTRIWALSISASCLNASISFCPWLWLCCIFVCWFASQTCAEIYKADGHSRPKTPAASSSPDKHHKINTAASPATASTDKTARTNVLSSTASSETCGRISDNYRWEWFPFGGLQTKAETLQSSEDPPI